MDKNKVYIFDTTLRDGEQVPGCQLNLNEKLEVALALQELKVDIIEAGFPVSSPGDFLSVSEISKIITESTVCALTRVVEKDIEVAAEAVKNAKRKRIHTGIATSEIHIKYKLLSTPEEVYERAVRGVKYARKFVDEVEFYAEDAGRTDDKYLVKVLEGVINAGATILNIPDTTGYRLPHEYGAKFKFLMENVKGIDKVILSAHCHNDLGLATANSMAAVFNGARQIECTINGIGERAGNTSLEEVVMIIKSHPYLNLHTEINTKMLCQMSEIVSRKMNMPVQKNKAIVGANAFSHSSGIHQDGVIKNRENYEIIDPKEVGADVSRIELTARSGKAALNYRLKKIGHDYTKEQVEKIYHNFLVFADKHKFVEDNDLLQIVKETKI